MNMLTDTKVKVFLDNFAEQFDEVPVNSIILDTKFRALEEWSSMHALLVLAMIDAEYDMVIDGDALESCITVGDIYELVSK